MATPVTCNGLSVSCGRFRSKRYNTFLSCLIASVFVTICTSSLPSPGLPEDLNWIRSGGSSSSSGSVEGELLSPTPGLHGNHQTNKNLLADRYAAFDPYQYFTVSRRALWGNPQVRPLTGREFDPQTLLALESLSAANDVHVDPNMFGEISRLVRDLAEGNKHRPSGAAHKSTANGSTAPSGSHHAAPDGESHLMEFVGNNDMHAMMPRIGKRNAALIGNGNLPRWLLASMDGDNNLAFASDKFRTERSTNGAMGLAIPRVG